MNEATTHADATAMLKLLQAKHPELKKELSNSYGFAIFPSVGRASAVLGGAYGHGEVFEQGKSIGFATLSQMTVGVQLGGQTFTEVVIFPKKRALDEFRGGKVAFTANASAVIVKAAASGTSNFGGWTAHAYSRGGMLLELSLGGQKFMFIPPTEPVKDFPEDENGAERSAEASDREANGAEGEERSASADSDEEDRDEARADEEREDDRDGESSGAEHTMENLRSVGADLMDKAREVTQHVPFLKHVPALKKEAKTSHRLHADCVATLKRMQAKDESLKKQLDEAYAYVVYPAVGKASLVLGGAYGKGEIFRSGKLVGYAGLAQITLGVQVGGQTYSQLVLLQDKEAYKRFKAGKVGFAANVSAVIVKAGAAATNNYKQGMQIYVHSEGGLSLEAAIGGQKLIFRHAGLMRGKPADRDPAFELGRKKPAVETTASA